MDLSIVIASRGDNYGGNPALMCQQFINFHVKKLKKLSLNFEIILVDYNLLPENRLKNFISEYNLKYVKIIEIENIILHKYKLEYTPFLENIAKNIGIDSAKGKQVLITNPEIRMTAGLLKSCVFRPFSEHSFLRTNRVDVYTKPFFRIHQINHRHLQDPLKSISRRLNVASLRNARKSFPGESKNRKYIITKNYSKNSVVSGLHTNASGDFICAPIKFLRQLGGFREDNYLRTMGDSMLVAGLASLNLFQVIYRPLSLFHLEHYRPNGVTPGWSESDWPAFLVDFNNILTQKEKWPKRQYEIFRDNFDNNEE